MLESVLCWLSVYVAICVYTLIVTYRIINMVLLWKLLHWPIKNQLLHKLSDITMISILSMIYGFHSTNIQLLFLMWIMRDIPYLTANQHILNIKEFCHNKYFVKIKNAHMQHFIFVRNVPFMHIYIYVIMLEENINICLIFLW